MSTGFIEVIVRPTRRRRSPRRATIVTRSGLRCTFTAGTPIDLAGQLLATALAWQRRGC